jgi:hypothetical protein
MDKEHLKAGMDSTQSGYQEILYVAACNLFLKRKDPRYTRNDITCRSVSTGNGKWQVSLYITEILGILTGGKLRTLVNSHLCGMLSRYPDHQSGNHIM